MSPLELVGDLDRIAEELRAARPVAPPALRERVAALEPREPRWTFQLPSRRLVLALALVALLGSFVAAGVTGLGGGTKTRLTRNAQTSVLGAPESRQKSIDRQGVPRALQASPLQSPSADRLQRYDAMLRLRVDDVDGLSRATQRAIGLTRALGGYVGSVEYATAGGKRGGATLVLRVPVTKVQAALDGLTDLGTILQQRTAIVDVTRRADREAAQIAQLERELEAASPSEQPAIRARLTTLRAKHARLLRSADLARIELRLTTPAKHAAAPPGRIERTLDDAGSVLLREAELLLYALVVAGPLLLLGGAAIATARAARKRSDRRLLERT